MRSGLIDQIKAYKHFVRLNDSEKILQVFESPRWPPFFGGKQFLGWIKETFFEKKREKEVPESVQLAPDLSLIKNDGYKQQIKNESGRNKINHIKKPSEDPYGDLKLPRYKEKKMPTAQRPAEIINATLTLEISSG